MSHKMVHIPEDDEPDTERSEHTCKPKNDIDRNLGGLGVKHHSIAECKQYFLAEGPLVPF